ncbi:transmembrane protein [Chaetomium sp. MPI-SDFR-AT-0129]|nr:transmembrane protein [Chaetomium sp. MPI-SDFR-AT-0129]
MRLDTTSTTPLLTLLSLITLLPSSTLAARPKDAILLSEVQTLTLRAPHLTTSRRLPPIPQLKCLSPAPLCKHAGILTLRCVNQGSSYTSQDIEWACTAPSLPTTVRLDRTDVICEGYESADDAYVLRGSCGVEYTVVLTEEGRRRVPELDPGRNGKGRKGGSGSQEENDWAGYLFGVLFVGVLVWILYNACLRAGENNRAARGRGGNTDHRRGPGGGGGGGWGPGWGPGNGGNGGGQDFNDPPPPYPGTGTNYGTNKPSSSSDQQQQQQGWRPGFWSGLAGGTAAGYLAGNRNNRYNTGGRPGWGSSNRGSSGWGGSNWNSNAGRGDSSNSNSSSGWGGRSGGGGSGRSSSSDSVGQHESTGYGSTSRR